MNKMGSFQYAGIVQKLIIAVLCAALVSSCAIDHKTGQPSFKETFASDDPCSNNSRNIGIGIGALAGIVLGNQVKHSNSARVVGAAAGALVGGLIGADIDWRRCELVKIAKQNNLDMQFEDINNSQMADTSDDQAATPKESDNSDQPVGMKVSVIGNGRQFKSGSEALTENIKTSLMPYAVDPQAATSKKSDRVGMKVSVKDNGRQFMSGSEALTSEALGYFRQIADQYSHDQLKNRLSPSASKEEVEAVESLKGKRILLVGHTDDIGSSALNADLSERRAKAVAKIFEERGISKEQLFFQGVGETLPMADNRTKEGRTKNRRVEIIDLADNINLQGYLATRKPALAYYRNSPANVIAASTTPASETKVFDERTYGMKQSTKNSDSTASSRNDMPDVGAFGAAAAIDFGGEPVGNRTKPVDIGKLPSATGVFSIISSAQADEPMAGSCTQDRPRVSRGVKSLKDGQEFAPRYYLRGFSDVTWSGMANGQLVTLANVAVLKDGGTPARHPKLLVYRDYKGDVGAKSSYSSAPAVNAYRGDKGVLYRVFVNGPLRCMDFVVPNNRPMDASTNLYYDRGKTLYMAFFNPKITQ